MTEQFVVGDHVRYANPPPDMPGADGMKDLVGRIVAIKLVRPPGDWLGGFPATYIEFALGRSPEGDHCVGTPMFYPKDRGGPGLDGFVRATAEEYEAAVKKRAF
jgi:hypothetical protein